MVNTQPLEEVEFLTHLGTIVDNLGGSDKDVKIRIGKARTAFNMMGQFGKQETSCSRPKYKRKNHLYGSETWKTTKNLLHKLSLH